MKASILGILGTALWLGTVLTALAQAQTPAPAQSALPSAASSEPEPAVQTSPALAAAPADAAPVKKGGASSPGKVPARAPGAASSPGLRPEDRIELDTTQISGNRELPKVMYVVPWRRADPGDIGARPQKSLLDEALTPVDRDVFRRQNRYYAALEPGAAAANAPAPESKDEK
ncbi:MAG: hypothetical protein ABSF96_01895 [Steroidobacteraceae bacterium]|jgi:hypothetical protein